MHVDFYLLADGTPLDIVGDSLPHSWPVVFLLGLLQGFISSGVSGHRVFMHLDHDGSLHLFNVWD